ncbi:hypothetical protein K443DRAFT_168371 [Laccaria amethystina LaAM-08-1]|uniref:Translation initiation factor 3 N-terminal domain-containing protein n=1 Tax=Laccaria amethystina LaAM-08-1 TaxID=1095629 RepID=A0A0C9YHY9_9AGAR|nr:hypothetical protein K443DRAFT_168371 [Laccaria amethystina LaAM-08-1]
MSAFLAFRLAAFSVLRTRPTALVKFQHGTRAMTSKTKQQKASSPRNQNRGENIKQRIVQLVDQETGKPGPPRNLGDILASIDEKTHYVELVSETPAPLVKIFDKAEEKIRYLARKAQAKASAQRNQRKEIQLTWSTQPGDIAHKLAKVREELEKGCRVDLVFAPKKKTNCPPIMVMRQRLDEFVAGCADLSSEWRERVFERGMGLVFLQSKVEIQVPDKEDFRGLLPKSVLRRQEKMLKEREKEKKLMEARASAQPSEQSESDIFT